jgi:hypothetical protein
MQYVYRFPGDEKKVQIDAIVMAYLDFFKDHPSFVSSSEKETLKERGQAHCQQLYSQFTHSLTNEYKLFCHLFLAFYTAAYLKIVRLYEGEDRHAIEALRDSINGTPPEQIMPLLRQRVQELS